MTKRCSSCRWWERSNNFVAVGRDWGLCHFFGGKVGYRIAKGFIDATYGHEPRGSDTCDFHNSDPSLKGAIMPDLRPKPKCAGEAYS
jgi:hypothetical protein